MALRIATWNVESIRAHEAQVLDWVEARNVDVLCMQETRASHRVFPRQGFERLGFDLTVFGGQSGRGGVAVASRVPVDEVDLGMAGAVAPLDEPRSISFSAAGLRVHTCYAPNGRKVGTRHHDIKLAWFSLFTSWIEYDDHPDARLVLGDLNIAPTDLDVWEPSRYRRRNLTSPPERRAFEDLLDRAGLVDVVRRRFEDERLFTWWNRRSDFYATDRGWRLDHVLAAPAIDARVRTVEVDRVERGRAGSTDHAPVLCEIV